jgi:hypothetical protein
LAYSNSNGSKSLEDKQKILEKVNDHFEAALDHPTWVNWRENAIKCFKYKEGDQWTSAEKTELENRHQPATVNNQVNVTINRMVGQFVKQKTRIAFRGRNSPEDDPTAQVLSDLFLYIRQNNALEFEERDLAEDGFTGGFGCLEAYVSFDDLLQPEIKMREEDPFNIFPDPNSRRYDWNEDATFICRAKWVDLDEAQELYPTYKHELVGLVNQSGGFETGQLGNVDSFKKENYVDYKTKRVRLVDDYYKVKEKQSICLFADGTAIDKTKLEFVDIQGNRRPIKKKEIEDLKKLNPNYTELDRVISRMECAVFTYGMLFDHKELKCKLFPFIPYYAYRKKDGQPYSLIEVGLSMQDAINKRESKALHLLNTNRAIYQTNSIQDKVELAIEMAKPDGQIEVRNLEQFKLDSNLELASTQYQMHLGGIQDFRRITGVNPDALGEKSEMRSGVGVARKQMMTDLIVAPIFDNFRRTRAIEAKVVLELIRNYYTEPKVFYITDDLQATKAINLDENSIASIKQSLYDVVVDDLPDVTTVQQEQQQLIATMLPQILPFGPFWTMLLFQMSEVRNKDEIIEQIKQLSAPPPTEPKVAYSAQIDKLEPIERAFLYTKMGAPEVAAAMGFIQPEPTDKAKARADTEKEKIKGDVQKQKAELDIQKAQNDLAVKTELGKLDLMKKQMEIQKALIDLANPNNGERNQSE